MQHGSREPACSPRVRTALLYEMICNRETSRGNLAMKPDSRLKIAVRGGDRLFVNGAILRMDRKVGIEMLNDATFLLEQHVIEQESASSPLRQFYFITQTILIEPTRSDSTRRIASHCLASLFAAYSETDRELAAGLQEVEVLFKAERLIETLKKIRALLPLEASVLQCHPEVHQNMQRAWAKVGPT